MKISIQGASNFVNRMFEACGNYQWARELLKNSIEAGARKVVFGIDWQGVEKLGVYRRMVADDGTGMDADELRKFFSTLGEGAKKIGGVHDNFGVGAKIATLPWNPEGVVVISYKGGRASMIWIVLDSDSGDYELVEFQDGERKVCVIDPCAVQWPEIDWGAVAPVWAREHGTVIVLLGSEEHPDTVLGNPTAGEKEIKGLSVYLNSRFWDLSEVEVTVVELRSERKAQWPTGPSDRDDARRANNRRIHGARHFLTGLTSQHGRLHDSGTVSLDEGRLSAEWYLWEGTRPSVETYARKGGYIAVRYSGELFQLTSSKAHFRWFGVIESKVQQNLTIILEPQLLQKGAGVWGIHPDQSRNRLIFTGNGEKGVEVPLCGWGMMFAEAMPEAVLKVIRDARGGLAGCIEDEDYRRRLQDRFGERWTTKVFVKAREGDCETRQGIETDNDAEVYDDPKPTRERSKRKGRKTMKILRRRLDPSGPDEGVEREAPVDVPRYRLAHAEEFDKPWHLALWAPNDPEGPTVLINVDSPILEEMIRHHQEQYLDVYAEEVQKTIHQVFGEVAACKVAHSQKLARCVPEEELNASYRSEQSLTLGLMGLLAEESLIGHRLAKLGRRKNTALVAAAG